MELLKQYLPLCWFGVSPLELPRSTDFFKNNLIFNFLIFFFIHFNMTDEIESISEVFFETLLNLGFIYLTLCLNRSAHSFVQVASGIIFCENFIAITLIPIMFWATVAEDIWSYGALALALLWSWLMIGAIFKNTLTINKLAGLVMALFYLLFSFGGGFAINSLVTG